ncbi:MAG TPA: PilZ domain-containing protein [Steroidobacteraceae bacterium]|nr:PilZ domain-containing protein [Steroidobacteraceae bacterium]
MNLYKQTPLYTQLQDNDMRRYPRKMFRQQVSVGLPGHSIMQGYTLDISAQGLSVLIAMPLKVGDVCAVRFNILINGSTMRVAGTGKVANCTCAGEGFRIGMHFKAQDPAVQQSLLNFTMA